MLALQIKCYVVERTLFSCPLPILRSLGYIVLETEKSDKYSI